MHSVIRTSFTFGGPVESAPAGVTVLPRPAARNGCATKIHRAIIDAGMIRRDLVEWRMMRRAILTIGAMVLAVAVCNARQLAPAKPAPVQHQPGIPSVD